MTAQPASVMEETAVPVPGPAPTLDESYAICRAIAKREAKNFYYSFVALPPARRNAICAMYAFMRKADDLSDDETLPRAERRRQLDAWLASWQQARAGASTSDPVFLAVCDAAARFKIPFSLLDELVAGATMDLESDTSAGPDTYATFADLYRYCYLVASVVGLVCIRIFGYSDPRAEKLAEETGIAFQLTNILRDVKEDAERGRIYLPLEDLDHHGVGLKEIPALRTGSQMTAPQRAVLQGIAGRAEAFYRSGRDLLPLIDADARPALWVLIAIYRDLLHRIQRRNYDVFTERVRVPIAARIGILLCGLAQVFFNRLFRRAPSPTRHA
jgi:15-cis-phytoene synthase